MLITRLITVVADNVVVVVVALVPVVVKPTSRKLQLGKNYHYFFLSHHRVVWGILSLLCVCLYVCTVMDSSAAEKKVAA